MSDNPTLDVIFSRSSYRGSYQGEEILRKDLVRILEAGIAAPSGCNRQTTSFIAVDDKRLVDEIKKIFPNPSCQTAPAFIVVLTQQIASVDGRSYHVQDYGAAMENMLLAIQSMGYHTCWYEGGVRAHAKEIAALLGVPDELDLVCLLPVGIAAEKVIPAKNKKPFSERAWFNGYGASQYF
ncbi:MAG: nitroreductase [Eubacterium sp.]|jgi:nitroreductase|nr:nitroreductase [Lachnospiraceae bacterium]MCI9128391.1 nitroreductase [Eubacterium sp.]